MRIHTPAGEIPIKEFTFPDGQPHVELTEADCGGYREATIEAAITSPGDLFRVLMAKDVLDSRGFVAGLDVRYLMGARMDRPIDNRQPHTLRVVARQLLGAGFRRIRVLDPHSSMTLMLLGAEAVYPVGIIDRVVSGYVPSELAVVAPDKGAAPRVQHLKAVVPSLASARVVQGVKHRDQATSKLSGFGLEDPSYVSGRTALILDDICDGGGTFSGLAAVLRHYGATAVHLFVTHGIFSRGLPIAGVDRIYTTDSYLTQRVGLDSPGLVVYPVVMGGAR